MNKTEAQKAIEDATLAIGQGGGKDFVVSVSVVAQGGGKDFVVSVSVVAQDDTYGNMGIDMAGIPAEIITGLIHAMEGDRQLRNVLVAAVNGYALNKLFKRDCDCPACHARRKKAQQN